MFDSGLLISKKQMRTPGCPLKVNILDISTTIPNNPYTITVFAVAGPRLWNNTLDDKLRGSMPTSGFCVIVLSIVHCNLF